MKIKIYLNIVFLAILFVSNFQSVQAFGAPDYLPDGPHPRIWLTNERLIELKAKRDSNDSDWNSLLSYCETHKNDTGYDVAYNPASWQSSWNGVPINQDGSPGGTGYRGSGYATRIINFSLCYQILKDVDLVKADEYASFAISLMHGLVNSFSVGEEINGLAIIRVGEREDITINQGENTSLGVIKASYKQGYSARNVGLSMALGYDWLHEKLTAGEKTKFYSVMYRWIDWYRGKRSVYNNGVLKNGIRYYEDQDGDCTGSNVCTNVVGDLNKGYGFLNPASNYYSGFFEMAALAPLATYGDNSDAQSYLDYFLNQAWGGFLKPVLDNPVQYKGGDSPEGWNYGSGWNRIIESLYAVDTASARDIFTGFDWPKEFLLSYMNATASTLKTMIVNGEWTGSIIGQPYETFMLSPTYIAKKKYPSEDIGKLGQYYIANANFAYLADNWARFLWGNYGSETKDFSTQPNFYRNIGTGLVTARSSWANSIDSVFMTAQLGATGIVSHENYDEGNITIQRGDDRLLVHENMKTASVAHNTIVFNNGNHNSSNPLLASPAIDAIKNTNEYFYVGAELSNACKRQWKVDTCKMFYRNMLYLRPGQVVVYDVTRSNSSAGNLKDWYTNFKSDSNISGDVISSTAGSSKIFIKKLFPASGTFTKCTSTVDGQEGYCGGAVPGTGYYRVKYTPDTLQEYDQFLHVVDVTDSGGSQSQSEMISGISTRGVLIRNVSENIVAMFTSDQDGADISSLSYSATTSVQSKHIVANLIPGQIYNLRIDSGASVQYVADTAGVLEFQNFQTGLQSYEISNQPLDGTPPIAPGGLNVE